MSRLAALVSILLATCLLAEPAHASQVAPASQVARAGSATSFTFGTHNSLRGTARFGGFADVICWQEVALPASKRKLVAQLSGYDHYMEHGLPGQVPISWRSDRFTLLEGGAVQAAQRVKSYSPPRYVARTVLLDNVTGRQVAVYNTHMVQGAWNDRRKPFKQMRQKNWRKHARVLRRELNRADPRIPVLACGDFNRVAYLNLPGLKPIRREDGRVGLDHLYRDTRGVRTTRAWTSGNAGSHHPPLLTTVTLRR